MNYIHYIFITQNNENITYPFQKLKTVLHNPVYLQLQRFFHLYVTVSTSVYSDCDMKHITK